MENVIDNRKVTGVFHEWDHYEAWWDRKEGRVYSDGCSCGKRNDVKTVINISSTDAVDTYNELSIDYCASKSALNSVTKTLSLAIPNITIVSLMLPWVNTEAIKEMDPIYLENELKRTGQKRLIEPNEVAEKIYDLVTKNNIKTGAIIYWGEIYE